MDLYFSPLACSLGARIALYEADARAALHRVDSKTRTVNGADYLAINPKGLVPALRTPEGEVISENAAVLQYIADAHPEARLGAEGLERYRLQQWLSFIGTELHKAVFNPLLSPKANEGAKAFARELASERLAYLDAHLTGRDYLLDRFSVADAYLAAILNWAAFVQVDLAPYPALCAYFDRLKARPAVARAMGEEMELFRAA